MECGEVVRLSERGEMKVEARMHQVMNMKRWLRVIAEENLLAGRKLREGLAAETTAGMLMEIICYVYYVVVHNTTYLVQGEVFMQYVVHYLLLPRIAGSDTSQECLKSPCVTALASSPSTA